LFASDRKEVAPLEDTMLEDRMLQGELTLAFINFQVSLAIRCL